MLTLKVSLRRIIDRIVRDELVKAPSYTPSTEPDERGIAESARWVSEWITRMSARHGGTVHGYGRSWDWGQALCVEMYGPDWNLWPDGNPTLDDVERARRWENGEWPEWAQR